MLRFDFLESINYCILHGWQGLPQHFPSDLDIAVSPKDLPRLERALLEQRDTRVINVLQHESTCYYFMLSRRNRDACCFLPVDAATDYRRDGRVWFTADELLQGSFMWNDLRVAGPEQEFKYLLVKRILKRGLPDPSASRLQGLVHDLGPRANAQTKRLLGRTWGPRVLTWIRNADRNAFERHTVKLKWILKWQRFKVDPMNPLRYWLPEFRRVVRRLLHPTGFWVAVLGPDGSGKTTLIRHLEAELQGAFRRVEIYHSKPRLAKNRKVNSPVCEPHAKPPRAMPFSLLKIGCYFLQHVLGYCLIVRPALVRSTLVLFDRYYQDLLIDPRRYRYGGPMGLVRFFGRFVPRPDIFLILDAEPGQLLQRKREVEPAELRRQMEAYRTFSAKTPIAFLVDAGRAAPLVAQEARELLLDHLRHRYIQRRRVWFPWARAEDLDWLSSALGVSFDKGPPTHAYLRLPGGRVYLLPLTSARTFRRALQLYSAQSPMARCYTFFLRVLSTGGLKGPGLQRITLAERSSSLLATLREVLQRPKILFSVSCGTPGPHRKPVLQVLTPEGNVLAYAKVGWNRATSDLVRREAAVVASLSKDDIPFSLPPLLYADDHNGRTIAVFGAPPQGSQPAPQRFKAIYMETLLALASRGVRHAPLEQTSFWRRIRARIQTINVTYRRRPLEAAANLALRYWKNQPLPLHFAHGDYTPWNALRVDGRLYLYDWEYASEEAPAAYDFFHFLTQTLSLVRRKAPQATVQAVLGQADNIARHPYHDIACIHDTTQLGWLFYLYLIDTFSAQSLCPFTPPDALHFSQTLLMSLKGILDA